MQILQQALEDALGKIPDQLFGELLSRKLKAQGITLSRSEHRRLQHHLLSGASNTLRLRRWRWWEDERIVLEFAEEETHEIAQRCNEVIEQLPALIENLTSDVATDILATLKRRWQGELRRQKREYAGFERRLYRRWGVPLGLFSANVVSLSPNLGLKGTLFSPKVGPKARCYHAGRFIFSGRYR